MAPPHVHIIQLNPSIRPKGTFVAKITCLISLALPAIAQTADYEQDIKPLFKKRCVTCHGPIKQKAGLRLDAGTWVLKGSDDGSVLKTTENGISPLVDRVSHHDEEKRMPPEGTPLTAEEIVNLADWIKAGARFPEDEVAADSPEAHWAFQIVKPTIPPAVQDKSWIRNPIDRFILAKLETKNWKPAPQASPRILLRRVSLDLTGLPPTLKEQQDFSRSSDLTTVIDDLLSRKTYGERWARHWLDAARYADTNGYERDAIKPYVWRYRDYVIDSLNSDKPYNRFVIEQLAGDELPDANAQTMIATGYLRLGHWDDEPADPETDRYDQLDDILNTTSQSMLGLTLSCARCHDHKFEPLSQKDYYSLIAIFNPLKRPQQGRTELAIPSGTRQQIAELKKRDEAIEKIDKELSRLRTAFERKFLEEGESKLTEKVIAVFKIEEAKKNAAQKKLAKEHRASLDVELDKAQPDMLRKQLRALEAKTERLHTLHPDLPLAYVWDEPSNNAPKTHLLVRGQPGRLGDLVEPSPPKILTSKLPTIFQQPSKHSTQRRLGLAEWIASPKNPLTARVFVNRVWQHHFGKGLVRTANDFGLMGEHPTHPELLDWLAYWFVHDAKWSIKKLHHLILTSNTWQMSSRADNDNHLAEDPENRLLWRQNHRRLEVEAIRDSILAISGQLNPEMHGPHTYPSVPPQALEGHSDPSKIWKPLDEKSASRRTIYAFVKRSLMIPMLETLDICDTTQPSPGRRVTTVAPQALTLYNGEFVNRQARHFARRLKAEAGKDSSKQINLAYQLALCRQPSENERTELLLFLEKEPLEQFCRVVFNLNELVYPD